jgi:acetyl-CoA acetyltransferase
MHHDAHLLDTITIQDVLTSRPIATPLKLLDCCPISDGATALIVTAEPRGTPRISIAGCGQAHRHQHLSAIPDTENYGARDAAQRAFAESRLMLSDIDYLAIYDSFTITLAILLEELGFAQRGESAQRLRNGDFSAAGRLPLNTHGGLLSFGHSGVAGGMAHILEAWRQLAGCAGARQIAGRTRALVHADGGVLSSHVSVILVRDD